MRNSPFLETRVITPNEILDILFFIARIELPTVDETTERKYG